MLCWSAGAGTGAAITRVPPTAFLPPASPRTRSDTPDVNLDSLSSLLGGGGGSSETPAAPEAPAAPAPEAAAPAPEAGNGGSPAALPIGGPTCDKTWAQVAGEAQPPLTILKTVLSQVGGRGGGVPARRPASSPALPASAAGQRLPSGPATTHGGIQAPPTRSRSHAMSSHPQSIPSPPRRPLPSHSKQAQYAGALPDPARNFTVFAPVDSAFFGLLTTFSACRRGFHSCSLGVSRSSAC